jgi:hypothetical protein
MLAMHTNVHGHVTGLPFMRSCRARLFDIESSWTIAETEIGR